MEKVRKSLFCLWKRYKDRQEHKHRQEEISAFNITEKDGTIYIIAGMRAIKSIDGDTPASDIIKALDECREAQIAYSR